MTNIIPEQTAGKKVDLSHSENFDSLEEAKKCFKRACKRMLNPRVWHELSGSFSASFYLQDAAGADPHRLVKTGDYLKIDIPGPGPAAGGGYDWVKVDLVEDDADSEGEEEHAGMRLVPTANPLNNGKDIAHFFTGQASSTFVLHRNGHMVTAYYHGRNELPNVKTDSIPDNIRNAVVSSGAIASLSEAQWMKLIKEFLQPEIGG